MTSARPDLATTEPADSAYPGEAEIRARARTGVRLLLVRLLLVQVTSLLVGILLARWLGPAPFGRLALANAVVSVFGLVGDLGLGAALISRQGPLDRADVGAVFTTQLGLGVALGSAVLVAGPAFGELVWGARTDHTVLAAVVVASLVLTPFRTAATVGLERDLLFGRVVAVELIEHFAYGATALVLAYAGHGVAALAVAIVARSLAGVAAAAALSPWRPMLVFDLARIRPLLRFGIAYQTTTIVYTVNSLVAPILVGRHGGDAALGLMLWAHGNAERPKAGLEVVARVAFPSFTRLGATPEVLRSGLERALHAGFLIVGLYGGVLLGCAPLVVDVLYTATWMPAVPYLYAFLLISPIVTLTILLDVAFLARGRSDWVRNFHIVRALLSWGVAIPATARFGAAGYVFAYSLAIGGFSLAELAGARRIVPLASLARAAAGPLASAAAAAAASRAAAVAAAELPGPATLAIAAAVGAAAFLISELAVDRTRLAATISTLLRRRR